MFGVAWQPCFFLGATAGGVRGAALNVRINAKSLTDGAVRAGFLERADALEARAEEREREILALVAKAL